MKKQSLQPSLYSPSAMTKQAETVNIFGPTFRTQKAVHTYVPFYCGLDFKQTPKSHSSLDVSPTHPDETILLCMTLYKQWCGRGTSRRQLMLKQMSQISKVISNFCSPEIFARVPHSRCRRLQSVSKETVSPWKVRLFSFLLMTCIQQIPALKQEHQGGTSTTHSPQDVLVPD